MKILIVHDYGVVAGGAERVTMDLRDGLRMRGHDARVFASIAQSFPLQNEADYTCFGSNGPLRPLLQMNNPWAVHRLKDVMAQFRPDIVHVRMFLTQLSPRILPLLSGVPALLHVGNHQTICPIDTRVLPDGSVCTFRAGAACYRQGCVSVAGLARTLVQLPEWRRQRSVFRLIVANSHALAATLRANDVDVTAVIWNGTRPVPLRPPLSGPPTIACAGRLMPLKGVDVLLRAMTIVARRLPNARLIIVGNGPDRQRIESLVSELRLGEHVTLCAHLARPELDERLGTAWVQAMPSRYLEPFANITAETMMRGTALVATNTGGTSEIVRDGITGFLVPPNNEGLLAERLLTLLCDRALAERMGGAGREIALAELTTDRMIDRFEDAYSRIL